MSERGPYRWASLGVASTRPLPELAHAPGRRVDITIDWESRRRLRPMPSTFHQWLLPTGRCWARFARVDGGYRIRFASYVDFLVAADGRRIVCETRRGSDPATLRHLLIDQVLPLAIGQIAPAALHASAIAIAGEAVGFAGESGRGKSTLTAALAAAGHAIVTDDCLVVRRAADGVYAVPTYRSLRLWADSMAVLPRDVATRRVAEYSSKRRVNGRWAPVRFADRALPLRRVYLLERSDTARVSIEPLSRRDAYVALLRHRFCLDPADRRDLRRAVEDLTEVTRRVAVRRLQVPWTLDAVPAVAAAVVDDVRQAAM